MRVSPGVESVDLAPGPAPQLPMEAFAARRERVAAALDDEDILVVATHSETTYSNDVHHPFRPHSDFWYLTGFSEPGAILTLGSDGRSDIWMRPREPTAEVWNGRRLGLERAGLLGIDHAHDIKDTEALHQRLHGAGVVAKTEHNLEAREILLKYTREDATPLLSSFRMIKDSQEIAMLQKAADVGMEAMRTALPLARPGRHEYEVEAALLHHYKSVGSTGPGYPPIVGTGANAAILHYIENRAKIGAEDLVLVDAGCEWGYYNSDITRTVPAAGGFTSLQADLYEVVWRAQEAALAKVLPGSEFKAPHEAAVETLVDGLVDLGILEGDKDQLIKDQLHRPFFMHGTSHFLGLDVHDVGAYKDAEGNSLKLQEGMCLTVEPGLYFNPDFATCPPDAVGIGIRIENDVMVTADGRHDLNRALPTSPDEVLAMMAA